MPLSLDAILKKEITVGVIGLGYVGLPLSLVFAEGQVKTLGFDIDLDKVRSLEQRESYMRHISSERLQEASAAGLFAATADFSRVKECSALLICVPTPLDRSLQPDLCYIEMTAKAIAPHLQPDTLVVLESTTWPGTTEEILIPLLEQGSALKVQNGLYVAFSPEREDPGNRQFSTKQIPKLVGGIDAKSLQLAERLYQQVFDTVIPLSSLKIAESAKLVENVFRSVNIALVNELKMIFDKMGIDVWQVLEAASSKPFGYMPFWPGPGLGGHCIPIDPFYLSWSAKKAGISSHFIELAGEINRSMPLWVISKVQDCLNQRGKTLLSARILVLGLAYKENIDDMRESPSLKLIDLLEEKGALVSYHDPYILEIGASREYGHLSGRKSQPISADYDCFILATKHSCFSPEEILGCQVPIIDTRHAFSPHENVIPA
ncbi:MAG: capL [Chlamydiales bacterium]|jgi:UDP-N-acetyl-D-glucosamine dehydrogenase|nr:capL [Chlamydiales bacterium]